MEKNFGGLLLYYHPPRKENIPDKSINVRGGLDER